MSKQLREMTDEDILTSSEVWIHYPFLPVVKKKREGHLPTCGTIVSSNILTVRMIGLYFMSSWNDFNNAEKVSYLTTKELLDVWGVD